MATPFVSISQALRTQKFNVCVIWIEEGKLRHLLKGKIVCIVCGVHIMCYYYSVYLKAGFTPFFQNSG